MKRLFLCLCALCLVPMQLFAWTDGELLTWMDAERGHALQPLAHKFFPKAWEAVRHEKRTWGYPIALETVTLIYNKRLLGAPPPTDLSQLVALNQKIKGKHPGAVSRP